MLQALPNAVVENGDYYKVGQHPCGFNGAGLPAAEDLPRYDLLRAQPDVDALSFLPNDRDRIRGFVASRGTVVDAGRSLRLRRGGWHTSDLLARLPAELRTRYDLRPVGVTKALKLAPANALAQGVDWRNPPVLLWQHVLKAKPDASVLVTAGDNPVIVTRPYGKGKVCFVCAAPLGDAPAGETAFWDWAEWPKLMNLVLQDLMK